MELKHIIETIHFDFVIEGLGMLFGAALLWGLLFSKEVQYLLSLFLTTIC